MTKQVLIIYGAGGHAREVTSLALALDCVSLTALIDDFDFNRTYRGLPIVNYEQVRERFPGAAILVAIGDPMARRRLYGKAARDGFQPYTLISPQVWISPTARIGAGSQVFFGAAISEDVRVGENVIVNFHCSLSHDVAIGAHTTLSPRVSIAGYVRVDEGVFLGIGATIINGSRHEPLRIGANAVIAAGACVISNVPANATMAGVPARAMRSDRFVGKVRPA